MILYIENPKDTTRKLLELINEYSKAAGYKINTQESLAFLYTNTQKTEKDIKETMPFTIAVKIIKYLGINLPRQWHPTPVLLPGESQGWGSLVGCHLWGRTESDVTEET